MEPMELTLDPPLQRFMFMVFVHTEITISTVRYKQLTSRANIYTLDVCINKYFALTLLPSVGGEGCRWCCSEVINDGGVSANLTDARWDVDGRRPGSRHVYQFRSVSCRTRAGTRSTSVSACVGGCQWGV